MTSFLDLCLKVPYIAVVSCADPENSALRKHYDAVPFFRIEDVQIWVMGDASPTSWSFTLTWKKNGEPRIGSGNIHCLGFDEDGEDERSDRVWEVRELHRNEKNSLMVPIGTFEDRMCSASGMKEVDGATIEIFNSPEEDLLISVKNATVFPSEIAELVARRVLAAKRFIEEKDMMKDIVDRRLDDVDAVSPEFGRKFREFYRLNENEALPTAYALFTAETIALVTKNNTPMMKDDAAIILAKNKRFCEMGVAPFERGVTYLAETRFGGLRNGTLRNMTGEICLFDHDTKVCPIPSRIKCLAVLFGIFEERTRSYLVCIGADQVCAVMKKDDARAFVGPLNIEDTEDPEDPSPYGLHRIINGIFSALCPLKKGVKDQDDGIEVSMRDDEEVEETQEEADADADDDVEDVSQVNGVRKREWALEEDSDDDCPEKKRPRFCADIDRETDDEEL